MIQPPITIGSSYTLQYKTLPLTPKIPESIESSVYIQVPKQIEYLKRIYIFDEPEEITQFLFSNEDLIEILLEARDYLVKIFGKVPIYLEFHHDPEEEWDELFIIIKTNYPPEKAVDLENKLFEEWFIKVIDKVKGRLSFTEEPL